MSGASRTWATLAVAAGALAYAISHALTKFLVGDLPPTEVFFVRSVMATLIVGGVMKVRTGVFFPTVASPCLVVVRGLLVAGSLLCLFEAFRGLSIAAALAIHLSSIPLASALNALWGRRTSAPAARVVLSANGFLGVVFIMQPQAVPVGIALAFAVMSAVFGAAALFLVGQLTARDTPQTVTFYLGVVAAVALAPLMPFQWHGFALSDLGLITLTGLMAWGGQFLITGAIMWSSNTYVAPLQYLSVVYAPLFDCLFWHVSLTPIMAGGISVIAIGGLVNFALRPRLVEPATP